MALSRPALLPLRGWRPRLTAAATPLLPGRLRPIRSGDATAAAALVPLARWPWRTPALPAASSASTLPGSLRAAPLLPLRRAFCAGASAEDAATPALPGPGPPPKPNPMSKRFAFTNKPFFPIYTDNLRDVGMKKKKKKRGAGKSGRRGITSRSERGSRMNSRTWEGGTAPLFKRVPRWPEAAMRNKIKKLETLNLSKLRYYIEKGRLDTRFPITQRHLYDCGCVTKIRNGVGLFNVNDFPFPYKIDIEVAGADQSSVDVIRAVGGSVTVVYMGRVTLRAHVKPWKYEVLPRSARPTLKFVHYMEKMKARGAQVRYIKPLWLIEEERRLQTQLRELDGDDANALVERMARANENRTSF
eukprot:TRINITY_DN63327_c0_g1_i1.p1 TRINITY_DN63327_c0_g1~~TRINITY_DN63327_c0_g1_i1.p1  ORF type:complete len:358 (+),score=57.92 TRINITY_DN63327_c0_g1_i1:75-1148(+)